MGTPLNLLKMQAQFSTDEIMPVLEQKISWVKGEEYVIDFFITNKGTSTTKLDVHYFAIPKKKAPKAYVKALFFHNDFMYTYVVEDSKHENWKKTYVPGYHNIIGTDYKDLIDTQDSDILLIGKEVIKIEDALAYLTLPHKPKYHLFNNFFYYGEEMDELSDTIESFAKQKVSTE